MTMTALDLLEEVLGDIAEAEAKIRQLRTVETFLREKLNIQNGTPEARQLTSPAPISEPHNPGQPNVTQAEAAEMVLREVGRPMSTNDLVDAILEKSLYPIKSDRKQMINSVFSAMRRNTAKFVKTSPGYWGLAEWPNEEANQTSGG